MKLRRLAVPAAVLFVRNMSDERKQQIADVVKDRIPTRVGPYTMKKERDRGNTAATFVVGAAAGGALVYLFDPARGRERRAKIRRLFGRRDERPAEDASRARTHVEHTPDAVPATILGK
jgi:hypothetical protein